MGGSGDVPGAAGGLQGSLWRALLQQHHSGPDPRPLTPTPAVHLLIAGVMSGSAVHPRAEQSCEQT